MDSTERIRQLKQNILSSQGNERQKSVDELIELEGMNAMDFFQSIFLMNPFNEKQETLELHSAAGYGVRQLIEFRANESKSDFRYCPYCSSELSQYNILDPYMIGLNCTNNHSFHIEVEDGEFNDKKLHTDKNTSIDIATEWLTNKYFRKGIQNQVADILRKYITDKQSDENQKEEIHSNNFCPVCSLPLEEFKQNDAWVQGLKCPNDHLLYERDGLSYKLAQLKPDITKATFDFLVRSYLMEDQKENLPDQIVTLLTSIVETSR